MLAVTQFLNSITGATTDSRCQMLATRWSVRERFCRHGCHAWVKRCVRNSVYVDLDPATWHCVGRKVFSLFALLISGVRWIVTVIESCCSDLLFLLTRLQTARQRWDSACAYVASSCRYRYPYLGRHSCDAAASLHDCTENWNTVYISFLLRK